MEALRGVLLDRSGPGGRSSWCGSAAWGSSGASRTLYRIRIR